MKNVINARINIKPEGLQQFLNAAKIVIGQSIAEIGCLPYQLFQGVENPGNFIIYEEYISQEAIDFHNSSNHFKTFSGI